ncbi:MAG: hypothetical protein HYV93_18330 [Candidatus Rokubacteria bacterium]|nr:hypothetical protein [Candidatus Rokubacteria bacterium]
MVAQASEEPPRFTVVIPPDRPDVREELAQELSGEDVEVVLERRRRERRPPSGAAAGDDRQPGLPAGSASPRVMYIVSRGAREQFQLVERHFADEPEIQVLYDRRQGDRRGPHSAPPAQPGERRQTDRRLTDIGGDLRAVGWALVRLGATA